MPFVSILDDPEVVRSITDGFFNRCLRTYERGFLIGYIEGYTSAQNLETIPEQFPKQERRLSIAEIAERHLTQYHLPFEETVVKKERARLINGLVALEATVSADVRNKTISQLQARLLELESPALTSAP